MSIESFPSINYNTVNSLSSVNQTIASGKVINSSADNPALQAIIADLSKQIGSQDVAIQNANMGINLIQTADGAADGITEQLQQLNELSIQASNGTYNDAQRSMFNEQFQQGLETINQIAGSTQFNGINLLDGSTPNINIALDGTGSGINLTDLTSGGLGLAGLDLTNSANIGLAQDGIANALLGISNAQGQFGAEQNGLSSTINNISTQTFNETAARSQMSDTNYAQAITEQLRLQVLNQAGLSMQAQSNMDQSNVLKLLS